MCSRHGLASGKAGCYVSVVVNASVAARCSQYARVASVAWTAAVLYVRVGAMCCPGKAARYINSHCLPGAIVLGRAEARGGRRNAMPRRV